jgi:carbamoyltransferase
MNILGISVSPSDHGFCFLRDGVVQSTMQNISFSAGSFESCLQQAGIVLGDLDLLAVCDNPVLQWQRIMSTCLSRVPEGSMMFVKDALPWIRRHAWMKKTFGPKSAFKGETLVVGRHTSLAAAAFFQSDFQSSAFLTFDTGVERAVSTFGVGSLNELSVLARQYYPHSLELFCSAFMPAVEMSKGDVDAFKVLASTGKPSCRDVILSEFMDLKEDGSFRLDMDCFEYRQGLTLSSTGVGRLKGAMSCKKDIARSVQAVAEQVLLRTLRHLNKVTGQSRLCMLDSGFPLCVRRNELLEGAPFDEVSIQDGYSSATGASLFAWYQTFQQNPISG